MTSRRYLPALLLLFVGSGCAALVYEIVWFQLLQLVIGSSAVSLGVLLGTFMGGMCLGSLLLPRFVSSIHHPLRVYAWLEIAIGIIGVAVLLGMPLVSGLYTAWAGTGIVEHPAPRGGRRDLPSPADHAHGRDAAGCGALGPHDS
jgi:spermidine synthase